ncbi:MAG: DUF4383 domain-containing protein [Thermoleophilia bacterium]|jgi:hypothetical protein
MSPETPLAPPDRAAMGAAQIITALFLALGILAALRTSLDSTEELLVFTVSPGTSLAWLAIGLVGAPLATTPPRARLYLAVTGLLLIAWGLAGVLVDDSASAMFARDRALIALHLIAGAAAVGAAAVSAAVRPPSTPSDGAPARTR